MVNHKPSYFVIGPSLKMGGMERASANLANSLVSQGHNCIYISLFNQEKFFYLDKRVKFIEPNFNYKKLNLIQTILWLRSILKNHPIKNVIVFNKLYSALTLLSNLFLSKKVFISERSSPFYKPGLFIDFFTNVVFYFIKPHGILSQTKIASEHQKKYYGEKIPILIFPNILRKVKTFNSNIRKNIILAVGRVNDHLKGFDRLPDIMNLLENKDWKLNVVGGDFCDFLYKNKIEDLNLKNRISFLGKLSSDELDKVYSESGIFVITSRSEGFPNALCEAMALGLPAVAFDFIAGPRDIIKNGSDGIIVDNNNIQAMANAIDDLIQNKSKRELMSNKAKLINQKFNEKKIISELINFIQLC